MDNETMQYIINCLESAKQHLLKLEHPDNFTINHIITIAKINHVIDVVNEYQKENEQS